MRYARQLNLKHWGCKGQQRLGSARVLIIGMGGLGNSCAQTLVAAGLGTLTINDFDRVDETNLPRQHLFRQDDIGASKVSIAAERLQALHALVTLNTIDKKLSVETLTAVAAEHDLVIDGTDNFASRFEINRACQKSQIALVSGAASSWQGMVGTFPRTSDSACYQCLFPDLDVPFDDCESAGVAPQLVGLIGNLMADAAIKQLISIDAAEHGSSLTRVDLINNNWKHSNVAADPQCAICHNH